MDISYTNVERFIKPIFPFLRLKQWIGIGLRDPGMW